jgi:DNA-binding beta-propeller fold protein YncE
MLSTLAALCLGGAVSAAPQLPVDNIKDRSVHWNTHLVSPLLLSEDGGELYAINQGGQRLAIFDPLDMSKLAEVPFGPGLVAMAQRPGTGELWLVDKVASSVSVLELGSRTIVRSLRVGGEPHGIAFTPSGDRAYVTCSGVDQVDVIDAASFSIAKSISIPAKNPRGIVVHQGKAFLVPLLSGNNTAPMGVGTSGPGVDDIAEVRSLSDFPGLNQLPDRDLLAISIQGSPALDDLDPSATQTGLGTMLFNLHLRPGTNELWIPNTEALNAVHKGEKNFVGGQCVQNRITIVDSTGVLTPQVVDLDALAPAGFECSQPTGVSFDPVRPLAYVCAYGSDRVAVLDLSGGAPTWFGSIEVPFVGYPDFSNPRTCVVDPAGNWLYVLNKGNKSVSRIDLTQLPMSAGFSITAPPPYSMGWDTVSGVERFGRNDLVNGKNSKSRKTSCASCHVDGHFDGRAWNLGGFHDPEGTPNEQRAFPMDDKGPLVTQSVRRMFGTGPYHWRGERDRLKRFNQAFIDLMEREENGEPKHLGAHFHYLERYMRLVSYVPNPRQNLDRSFTLEQANGAQLFTQKEVLGSRSCAGSSTS